MYGIKITKIPNCFLLSILVILIINHFATVISFVHQFIQEKLLSKKLAIALTVIFTARCYASAVLAMAPCPSVRLCPSDTSRSSIKTAKRRIAQTTPHDSPVTLVFCCQRSPRNSTGVTLYEGAECSWGGSKSATFD